MEIKLLGGHLVEEKKIHFGLVESIWVKPSSGEHRQSCVCVFHQENES